MLGRLLPSCVGLSLFGLEVGHGSLQPIGLTFDVVKDSQQSRIRLRALLRLLVLVVLAEWISGAAGSEMRRVRATSATTAAAAFAAPTAADVAAMGALDLVIRRREGLDEAFDESGLPTS